MFFIIHVHVVELRRFIDTSTNLVIKASDTVSYTSLTRMDIFHAKLTKIYEGKTKFLIRFKSICKVNF